MRRQTSRHTCATRKTQQHVHVSCGDALVDEWEPGIRLFRLFGFVQLCFVLFRPVSPWSALFRHVSPTHTSLQTHNGDAQFVLFGPGRLEMHGKSKGIQHRHSKVRGHKCASRRADCVSAIRPYAQTSRPSRSCKRDRTIASCAQEILRELSEHPPLA